MLNNAMPLLAACLLPAVLAAQTPPQSRGPAPRELLGAFSDDYGDRFRITDSTWTQLPRGRLNIKLWSPADHFLIAQNDSGARYAPGRWTRIDWVELTGMAPFRWAFCLTAYDAESFAAALNTPAALAATPKTGCNKFPFSRMQPDTTVK